MQSLEIISVNIWSILVSLANLLIMFLILKRFLFKPVQKMMAARKQQVDQIYQDAKENRDSAINMKQEYEARLAAAREEADGLVRNAVQTAQRKGDAIVAEANSQASHLKQKAEQEIAQEKKQMLQDVRGEISDIAVSIASKVVEREVKKQDYDGFVDEFIKNVGEQQ
ncbi:MAG: F0F1 ATP synthase subunit B [Clostridiales bacterium]|nr:F0F1 ATP synthase subunit B [Eubacteriales bacterium]MCI5766005.1 F0F1 ATP synthase subunit B [Clostridiales bacterium]MDD7122935.1 F0F1 ATP synthase subunit B [Clostridiales bacterium]MDY5468085.1 F0F1 ATP synthase subunit B [Eubacteriales bacterium]